MTLEDTDTTFRDTTSLVERGRAHTRLREMLDSRATILHAGEREIIIDAADALLFDEADAWDKRARAREVLTELVDNGRWLAEPADDVASALDDTAGPELARH
jgi:hypothetical protein